jgi:hypothetical protein
MAAVRQANHDASPEQGAATYPAKDTRSYLLFTIFTEQAERKRAANFLLSQRMFPLPNKGG